MNKTDLIKELKAVSENLTGKDRNKFNKNEFAVTFEELDVKKLTSKNCISYKRDFIKDVYTVKVLTSQAETLVRESMKVTTEEWVKFQTEVVDKELYREYNFFLKSIVEENKDSLF